MTKTEKIALAVLWWASTIATALGLAAQSFGWAGGLTVVGFCGLAFTLLYFLSALRDAG